MKKFAICLILTGSFFFASAQWHYHNPLPQGNTLHDMFFLDSQNGIALGDRGTILKTRDGGVSWEYAVIPFKEDFTAITFLDPQQGFLCGSNASIMRTTDGGNTWEAMNTCCGNNLLDIHFCQPPPFGQYPYGIAVGENGFILISHDGSNSWRLTNSNTSASLYSVCMIDALHAIVVGENGTILFTSDGGTDWETRISYSSATLRKVVFMDDSTGWIIGDGGLILKTTDAGTNWFVQSTGVKANLDGICFCNPEIGWAVGQNGMVLHTEDGGLQWTPQILDSIHDLSSAFTPDMQNCYIVGENGVIFKTSDTGNSWEALSSGSYTAGDLYFGGFTDDVHGWTCSRSGGEIYHTNDGGTTWTGNGSIPLGVSDIVFTNPDQGWRVDNGCTIFKTLDGGKSWDINYQTNEFERFSNIFFINPKVGWVTGTVWVWGYWDFTMNYLILKTTNGGQTWSRIDFLYPSLEFAETEVTDLYFTDEMHGWATGYTYGWLPSSWEIYWSPQVLRTTNGGSSWMIFQTEIWAGGIKIFFSDNNVGWIIDRWGGLHKSANAGSHWEQINDTYILSDVYFTDSDHGWAVCQDGSILHSDNGGLTWDYQNSPPAGPLNRILFTENGDGWAFGNGSAILHRADSTMVSMADYPGNQQTQVSAYPNPFCAATTIEYELKEKTSVTLTIFNHLGKEVDVLVNESQSTGKHEAHWNAGTLPAGIYYCRLQAGNQIESAKIIKIQ